MVSVMKSEVIVGAAALFLAASFASASPGPSCDGGPGAGDDCHATSCCRRILVPEGSFHYAQRGDEATPKVERRVASFYLDAHEATVGRFGAWVRAGSPMPELDTTLQVDLNGKPIRWTAHAGFAAQRGERLAGWRRYDTWSAAMHTAPKNNINWYTAAAFCHWDGGRLPTEVEWQYAAVGGDEERPHPWGASQPAYDLAVYNCHGDGHGDCSITDFLPVGSKPKGAARWGHLDMVGSVFEWTVSSQGGGDHSSDGRSRGGGFCYIGGRDRRAPPGLTATTARYDSLETVSHMVGVRCAYDSAG